MGAEEADVIESTVEAAAPPEAAGFRALIAAIQPRPAELRWLEIPWETDLWAARRLAAESGKPIFLWAMNGNPLGCT